VSSINKRIFNSIHFEWDNKTLCEVDKSQADNLLHKWFSNSTFGEPDYAVLVFKNKDAFKISQWVRKNVQNKKSDFVEGDLLLVNNNFNIPDESGLSYPQRIQNGMYLQVTKQLERHDEHIKPQGHQPITLKFIKLEVVCVSLKPQCKAEIWILENFFNNSSELTIEEQIAFRVLVSKKISTYIDNNKFEDSSEYKILVTSSAYQELVQKQKEVQKAVNAGERVKTELKETSTQLSKLERKARKRFRQFVLMHLLNTDPLINVAFVQYAYGMTVHKALGSTFKEVLLNNFQGEGRGVTNESYFRWLYTGISCGLDSVKIINPVVINPLMDCLFEDSDKITIHVKVSTKPVLVFPIINIPEEIKKCFKEEIPENPKQGITVLGKILQDKGYFLEKVSSGNYLVKLFFSTPNGKELEDKDKLVIAMNYNIKNEVSSIRIEKGGKSNIKTVEECIARLTEHSNIEPISISTVDDFRKETYQKWQHTCELLGYQLKLIEEQDYQSIFSITKGNIQARFKVGYNGSGFFTQIKILEKSSNEISIEIKKMLLNGNQT
jgi:hypothetical protein